MDRIGIFFGSNSGSTANLAEVIADELSNRGFGVDVMDVASVSAETFDKYDNLIFGTSTMGMGVLQDDWDNMLESISEKDFSGKKLAFFGTGDQRTYPDTFVDGIGVLFDAVKSSNANIIGRWSTDGYVFRESIGVEDNKFIGLALDEDNQQYHSHDRIKAWVEQVSEEINKSRN